MALPKPKPEEVEGFPHDNPKAVITALKGKSSILLYVSVRENFVRPDGSAVNHLKHLGKIAEGRYYPMEEYRRLFKRNGQRIDEQEQKDKETAQPAKRAYKRKKPLSQNQRRKYPSPFTLKGFPKSAPKTARICKIGGVLYVVNSTYSYDNEGKSKEHRTYLGRVMDGDVFVTLEQYRQLTAGAGLSRSSWKKGSRSSQEQD